MKRCSKCRQMKESADFFSRQSGYCKECQRAYRRERYVPVTADTEQKLKADPKWRERHNKKQCQVCKKFGSETMFRTLGNVRCSRCMKYGLYRCTVHGVIKQARCQKCRYQKMKALSAQRAEEAYEQKKAQVLLTAGIFCARCGATLRGNETRMNHRCD